MSDRITIVVPVDQIAEIISRATNSGYSAQLVKAEIEKANSDCRVIESEDELTETSFGEDRGQH